MGIFGGKGFRIPIGGGGGGGCIISQEARVNLTGGPNCIGGRRRGGGGAGGALPFPLHFLGVLVSTEGTAWEVLERGGGGGAIPPRWGAKGTERLMGAERGCHRGRPGVG